MDKVPVEGLRNMAWKLLLFSGTRISLERRTWNEEFPYRTIGAPFDGMLKYRSTSKGNFG
jgi:hypothetical protein